MTAQPNPYQSPSAADTERPEVFRSSLWYTTGMMLLYGYTVLLASRLVQSGLDIQWATFALALVPTTAFVVVLSGVAVWLFPVYATSTAVKSYNVWGFYRQIPWEEITQVRPINLPGLKYLRLYSGDAAGPIWIPIFLADRRRFIAYAQSQTTAENPLHRYLSSVGGG